MAHTHQPTILAIETSSELASCALLKGDALAVLESNGVRTHSQSVLPMVQQLLADAGLALSDCDAIAFGAGPGSFTGVRTACGVAQGLAFGAQLPVAPVCTLEAVALACHEQGGGGDILVVLDARMGEVYWAQYRATAEGQLQAIVKPTLSAPGALHPEAVPGLTACGNGLAEYRDALGERLGDALPKALAAGRAAMLPHAAQVAVLGRRALAAGRTVQAADAQPIYLRNKVAYTAAERQLINAGKAQA
jgi:tRNA threonylcarbamoyladenosine biosynthesis protein TsaB